MLAAISLMRSVAWLISCAWCSAASARCIAVAWVSCALEATCTEVSVIVCTRLRSCSTAKLIESAIAPVMSSVTVAFTVRSPSASEPISSSRRMIASWLRLLSSIVDWKRARSARRVLKYRPTSEISASAPDRMLTHTPPTTLVSRSEPNAVSERNRSSLSESSWSEPLASEAAAVCALNRFCDVDRIASRSFFISTHNVLAWLSEATAEPEVTF